MAHLKWILIASFLFVPTYSNHSNATEMSDFEYLSIRFEREMEKGSSFGPYYALRSFYKNGFVPPSKLVKDYVDREVNSKSSTRLLNTLDMYLQHSDEKDVNYSDLLKIYNTTINKQLSDFNSNLKTSQFYVQDSFLTRLTKYQYDLSSDYYMSYVTEALERNFFLGASSMLDGYFKAYPKTDKNYNRAKNLRIRSSHLADEVMTGFGKAISEGHPNTRKPKELIRIATSPIRNAKRSGHCIVEYDVKSGVAINAKTIFCTHKQFEKPSLKNIYKWKFEGAILDGKPIDYRGMRSMIKFKGLDKKGNTLPE